MQPLCHEWQMIQAEAASIREGYNAELSSGTQRSVQAYGDKLLALRTRILHRLRSVTVLDPACGSGKGGYHPSAVGRPSAGLPRGAPAAALRYRDRPNRP
jgi:hypothetical protein